MTMTETLRRIVTSHDGAGFAVVRSDEQIPIPPLPGIEAREAVVWSTFTVPAGNIGDEQDDARDVGATLRGGSVFRVTEFGPGFTSPMHRTHSIDYCCLLSGTLEMVLDGGDTVRLAPGDVVVQRGANHPWRNPSIDAPARLIVCMIEAEPITIDGNVLEQSL